MYLRGHTNTRKRLLIHTSGFNLGLLMRQLSDVGTPRGLQGRLIAVVAALWSLMRSLRAAVTDHGRPVRRLSPIERQSIAKPVTVPMGVQEMVFTTSY